MNNDPKPEGSIPHVPEDPEYGSVWRHFKGGEYVVLAVALHSETKEPLVIYRENHGNGPVWARPHSEWHQDARPGVRRFAQIEP